MGLPRFIPPMLAETGTPFDSDEYFFEVKWDGYRALLFVEDGAHRIMSRNAVLLNRHYPALDFLSRLPGGTVMDGELVAFVDGKPDFEALRGNTSPAGAVIVYFAFDILYKNFEPQMALPLAERRRVLETAAAPYLQERLLLNPVVDTHGTVLFEQVKAQGLEGIIAKKKESPYLPGTRDIAWQKMKVSMEIYCLIMGYMPHDDGIGFKSLILASDTGGELRYVGRVGTGYSHKQKDELFGAMRSLVADGPCVPCPEDGVWIKPELYCRVGYSGFTRAGMLRAPVFISPAR